MSELYHHGILGQKWGVRRFQDRNGRLTAAGKKRYGSDERQADQADDKPKPRKNYRALKIGAGVAVTALAAYGGYRLVKSGKLDALIEKGKLKVNGILNEPDGMGQQKLPTLAGLTKSTAGALPKTAHAESISEAIGKVNPSRAHNNCYNVVTAFAARLCGYDVTARGDTQGGKGLKFDDICRLFHLDPDNPKDVKRVGNPTVDRITSVIGRYYKEGDVGAIGLSWNQLYASIHGLSSNARPGHTLNWMIQNGKVEFMDGQQQIRDSKIRQILSDYLASDREVSVAKFGNVMVGLNEGTDLEALKKRCT